MRSAFRNFRNRQNSLGNLALLILLFRFRSSNIIYRHSCALNIFLTRSNTPSAYLHRSPDFQEFRVHNVLCSFTNWSLAIFRLPLGDIASTHACAEREEKKPCPILSFKLSYTQSEHSKAEIKQKFSFSRHSRGQNKDRVTHFSMQNIPTWIFGESDLTRGVKSGYVFMKKGCLTIPNPVLTGDLPFGADKNNWIGMEPDCFATFWKAEN